MSRNVLIKSRQEKLSNCYKQLIEQAYNFRQTDHALSDYSEFKAMKVLHKINQIKFLARETSQPIS